MMNSSLNLPQDLFPEIPKNAILHDQFFISKTIMDPQYHKNMKENSVLAHNEFNMAVLAKYLPHKKPQVHILVTPLFYIPYMKLTVKIFDDMDVEIPAVISKPDPKKRENKCCFSIRLEYAQLKLSPRLNKECFHLRLLVRIEIDEPEADFMLSRRMDIVLRDFDFTGKMNKIPKAIWYNGPTLFDTGGHDTIITTSDETTGAHSNYLKGRSHRLDILIGNWHLKLQGVIAIRDISANAFDVVLQFLYDKLLDMEQFHEHCLEVLLTALRLEIPYLALMAEQLCRTRLTMSTCMYMLSIAHYFGLKCLLHDCKVFVRAHAHLLIHKNSYKCIVHENPDAIRYAFDVYSKTDEEMQTYTPDFVDLSTKTKTDFDVDDYDQSYQEAIKKMEDSFVPFKVLTSVFDASSTNPKLVTLDPGNDSLREKLKNYSAPSLRFFIRHIDGAYVYAPSIHDFQNNAATDKLVIEANPGRTYMEPPPYPSPVDYLSHEKCKKTFIQSRSGHGPLKIHIAMNTGKFFSSKSVERLNKLPTKPAVAPRSHVKNMKFSQEAVFFEICRIFDELGPYDEMKDIIKSAFEPNVKKHESSDVVDIFKATWNIQRVLNWMQLANQKMKTEKTAVWVMQDQSIQEGQEKMNASCYQPYERSNPLAVMECLNKYFTRLADPSDVLISETEEETQLNHERMLAVLSRALDLEY